MALTVIYNKPRYQHTISEEETTFLYGVGNVDYYYRNNGVFHVIDARHSNEPSDYTNWTIGSVSDKKIYRYGNGMAQFLPKQAYDRAVELILRRENTRLING